MATAKPKCCCDPGDPRCWHVFALCPCDDSGAPPLISIRCVWIPLLEEGETFKINDACYENIVAFADASQGEEVELPAVGQEYQGCQTCCDDDPPVGNCVPCLPGEDITPCVQQHGVSAVNVHVDLQYHVSCSKGEVQIDASAMFDLSVPFACTGGITGGLCKLDNDFVAGGEEVFGTVNCGPCIIDETQGGAAILCLCEEDGEERWIMNLFAGGFNCICGAICDPPFNFTIQTVGPTALLLVKPGLSPFGTYVYEGGGVNAGTTAVIS